jgi:hypothetical protein
MRERKQPRDRSPEPNIRRHVGQLLDRVTTGRDAASGTKDFAGFSFGLTASPFARPRVQFSTPFGS